MCRFTHGHMGLKWGYGCPDNGLISAESEIFFLPGNIQMSVLPKGHLLRWTDDRAACDADAPMGRFCDLSDRWSRERWSCSQLCGATSR